jgi:hypothetical protein
LRLTDSHPNPLTPVPFSKEREINRAADSRREIISLHGDDPLFRLLGFVDQSIAPPGWEIEVSSHGAIASLAN